MKTTTSTSIPADIRQVIVTSLAKALVSSYLTQQLPTNDERPAAAANSSGRAVHGDGNHELPEVYHP